MGKNKKAKSKGKKLLSRYFQGLKEGDSVSIVKEKSEKGNFPLALQGRTGVIEGKKGGSYVVKVPQKKLEKRFIIQPIHLKKINKLEGKSK